MPAKIDRVGEHSIRRKNHKTNGLVRFREQGVQMLTPQTEQALCAAFDPQGKRIALGTETRLLLVEPSGVSRVLYTNPPNIKRIEQVAWNSAGTHLAVGFYGSPAIVVLEVASGKPVGSFESAGSSIYWSPHGEQVAVFRGNLLKCLTLATGQVESHTCGSKISSITWNPDSNQLAVGLEKTVAILDSNKLELIAELPVERTTQVASLPPGNLLCLGDHEGKLRIWDMLERQPAWEFALPEKISVGEMCWSPQANLIAVNDQVRWWIYDLQQRQFVGKPEASPAFAWSPDGKRMLTSEAIMERATGEKTPHAMTLHTLAWRPDGTYVGLTPTEPNDDQTGPLLVKEGDPHLISLIPNPQGVISQFDAAGHLLGGTVPEMDGYFVYYAELEDGSYRVFTPSEFHAQFMALAAQSPTPTVAEPATPKQ